MEFQRLIPATNQVINTKLIRLNCLAIAAIKSPERDTIVYLANEYFNFVMNGMAKEGGVIYQYEAREIPQPGAQDRS